MSQDNENVKITTTAGSLNDEIQVDPGDYEPPPPPPGETITSTTTDTDAGLTATEGVPVRET